MPPVLFFPAWLITGLAIGWLIDRVRTPHPGLSCRRAQRVIDEHRAELDDLTACTSPQRALVSYGEPPRVNTFLEVRRCEVCRGCRNRADLLSDDRVTL